MPSQMSFDVVNEYDIEELAFSETESNLKTNLGKLKQYTVNSTEDECSKK